MLLKDHLIEVFKQAFIENNLLLKENIVMKWVYRFEFDSLNDLLIHSPVIKENQYKKNKEQIKFELKTLENIEETTSVSKIVESSCNNGLFSKNLNYDKIKQFTNTQKLQLPYIKNLRKWINKDKIAS